MTADNTVSFVGPTTTVSGRIVCTVPKDTLGKLPAALVTGSGFNSTDWAPTETDWVSPAIGTEPVRLENAPLTPFIADISV
jgi:hypothetical protein